MLSTFSDRRPWVWSMLYTLFAEGRRSLILDSEMANTFLRFIPFISAVSLRYDSEDTDGWCMAMIGLYGWLNFQVSTIRVLLLDRYFTEKLIERAYIQLCGDPTMQFCH